MNPEIESRAWSQLRSRAASRITPGFADRVLRAARAGVEAAPSILGQFLLGAATAAACALIVVLVHVRATHAQDDRSIEAWQAIASSADDLGQMQ
jgi:uncharacterized membrane protein